MDVEMIEKLFDTQPELMEELDKEVRWVEEHGQYIEVGAASPDEFERIWQRIIGDVAEG